jgi:hypothetical protein
MLRFAIRDVLWLMVVVAMGCVIALSAIERQSMKERLGSLERSIERHQRNEVIFKRELGRLTGRRVSGWTWWADQSGSNGFGSSVDYEDDQQRTVPKSD